MKTHRPIVIAALVAMLCTAGTAGGASSVTRSLPEANVGVQVAVADLVLPGAELEPVPVDDATPVIIRVDAVSPHGSDLRYDLVCSGLEPGEFDLRRFLRRKDGSSTDDLPELLFRVNGLLPPGQMEPHPLQAARLPWLGGYRSLLLMGGLLWSAALVWLLMPRKPQRAPESQQAAAPETLADRLRPLVTDAIQGRVSPARLAELERALVQYWRRRLSLDGLSPAESIAALRAHPEASPLLVQLESWLHRPGGDRQININELLEPYRNVSPDDLHALTCGERVSAPPVLVGESA
jgi:hypothetical protein